MLIELDQLGEIIRYDEEGRRVFGGGGKPNLVKMGVRGRETGEGAIAPWRFVERDCELAVMYSWVRENDKQRAWALLRGAERGTRKSSL